MCTYIRVFLISNLPSVIQLLGMPAELGDDDEEPKYYTIIGYVGMDVVHFQ